MLYKELVIQLSETSDPEARELLLSQYIITLEQQNVQLRKELAQARTVAASVYIGGRK